MGNENKTIKLFVVATEFCKQNPFHLKKLLNPEWQLYVTSVFLGICPHLSTEYRTRHKRHSCGPLPCFHVCSVPPTGDSENHM